MNSDQADATTASHLARNLVSLRHTRALTQDGLAKAASVPRSTIANLESGEGNPSLAVLVKVAGALGVPIDELLASPRAMVRRWRAAEVATRMRGRGVTIRELVPEPVPDEMMEVMEFEPAASRRRSGMNAAGCRETRARRLRRARSDRPRRRRARAPTGR